MGVEKGRISERRFQAVFCGIFGVMLGNMEAFYNRPTQQSLWPMEVPTMQSLCPSGRSAQTLQPLSRWMFLQYSRSGR